MTKRLAILTLLTALFSQSVVAQDADGIAFFEKKIRPVLVEHCYKCHAVDSKSIRGGLLLDTREGIRKGGDSGPAVVPHKIDESLLIESLRYDGYEMPPSGKLPNAVIADFEKWVTMGAPDPRDGQAKRETGIDLEAGRKFWAFQPPKDHLAPTVKASTWPKNSIDRFTLSRMEQNKLEPTIDADRQTLLRRVYFDLVGLPPSPADIDAFLQDESDHALESVVDELLSSRHFGERWGRHWLDVARYSDSTGGGRSLLFKVAWRYRNYVIDAFNRDTPFDEFIVEQIAGDLMASKTDEEKSRRLTATGFLALGPTNYENQDKRQLRMDVVDEQIDTIGRAFLGMTIGCARCHDHKFDPIPTTDYYALAGIFRSTRSLIDGNVSSWVTKPLPKSGGEDRNHEIAAKKKLLKRVRKRLDGARQQFPALTIDDNKAELSGKWEESTYVKGFVGKRYLHTSDRTASASYTLRPAKSGRHEVLLSYTAGDNRETKTPVSIQQRDKVVAKTVDQRTTPQTQFISLGIYDFDSTPVRVTITAKNTNGVVIADAVQLRFVGDENLSQEREQLKQIESELKSVQASLKELQKQEAAREMAICVDEEKEPGDFHVCIRGNVRNLGDEVPRGFLSVATSSPVQIAGNTSGRLELAKWIASDQNPLTARVTVNRIWHHLFGSGLVRTVDNFGVPGERPSHPQLLDHLAIRFTRGGWSVKKLIREIVLSRTYRQSSVAESRAIESDPENRFFARQNVRRLQAEALRDALFSVSGELDVSPTDDSVRPGTKTEYGYQFTSKRRSVYLPVFRNRLHPMFAVFDFPDPNLSNGRRTVSTLSTQALFLMNSPLVNDHARKAAKKLLSDPQLNDRDRIRLLYQTALGREPTASEAQLAADFLASAPADHALETWASLCQAIISSVDFRYVR